MQIDCDVFAYNDDKENVKMNLMSRKRKLKTKC